MSSQRLNEHTFVAHKAVPYAILVISSCIKKLSTDRLGVEEPSEVCSPSGCCSLRGYGHPRAACQRRSGAVGPGGYPPCLFEANVSLLRFVMIDKLGDQVNYLRFTSFAPRSRCCGICEGRHLTV